MTSAYYQTLVRTDPEERKAAFGAILDGLRTFTKERKGLFWGGDSLGLVDCVLLPYAYRLYVLEHYRFVSPPSPPPPQLFVGELAQTKGGYSLQTQATTTIHIELTFGIGFKCCV